MKNQSNRSVITRHRAALICVAMVCLYVTPSFAEEKDHDFRVLGLFQADRESDLAKLVTRIPDVKLVKVNYKTGAATFRFDAEKVFPRRNTPEKLAESLDQIVRRESRGTFQVLPLSGVDRTKLKRVEITVHGLDCKGCSFGAYLAVYKIDGVENATASFQQKKVVAWVLADKTTKQVLVDALKKAGVDLGEK